MTQDKALEILKTGANVFLTGEPGSGKTYTVNKFIEWCKQNGKRVAVTASTGIAATHINGKTIHSWCAMGIKEKVTEADIATIMTKPYAVEAMEDADVLIIDEISMLSGNALDNVDLILQKVRTSFMDTKPFGGLQVVFVGDFFQLPPVSKRGVEPAKFAFESEAWKNAALTICYLTEQHRQEDKDFLEVLTQMRSGKITEGSKFLLKNKAFGAKERPETKLFTHNLEVDDLNRTELMKIDGEERTFVMESGGVPFLVDTLKKQCLSPERLVLRVGAKVMFTRNNFEEDYVNGTLGTVVDYTSNGMPIVETKDGRIICVKYAEWSIEDTKAWISQVPLRLAWAITVHKSQGMSLDEACIDLSKCFEYGQGYVALSRVRSLAGLCLDGINDHAFLMHPKVVEMDKEFRKLSEENNA